MTESKKPLSECIEAERIARSAVEEAKQFGLPADMLNERLNILTGARAATDEAVKAVEAERELCLRIVPRLMCYTTAGIIKQICEQEGADYRTLHTKGVIQPTTTGGASDE